MLVSSLDDIKSTELVIYRFACCNSNEIVVLCDASDRGSYKIRCDLCNAEHGLDMKPVFKVGTFDSDDNVTSSNSTPKDTDILSELKKIDMKFKVI